MSGGGQSAYALAGTGGCLQPRGRWGLAAVWEATLELPDPAEAGFAAPISRRLRRPAPASRVGPLDGFSPTPLAEERGGRPGEASG